MGKLAHRDREREGERPLRGPLGGYGSEAGRDRDRYREIVSKESRQEWQFTQVFGFLA